MTPKTQWLKVINTYHFPWSCGSARWFTWASGLALDELGCHTHVSGTYLGWVGPLSSQGSGLDFSTYQWKSSQQQEKGKAQWTSTFQDSHITCVPCPIGQSLSWGQAKFKGWKNRLHLLRGWIYKNTVAIFFSYSLSCWEFCWLRSLNYQPSRNSSCFPEESHLTQGRTSFPGAAACSGNWSLQGYKGLAPCPNLRQVQRVIPASQLPQWSAEAFTEPEFQSNSSVWSVLLTSLPPQVSILITSPRRPITI